MLLNQEKPTRILVELEIVSGFHRYSINTHTDTQTLTHLLLLFQSPGHIKEFCLKNTSFPRNNWPQYLGNGPQFSSGVKSDFTQRSEHSALPSSSLVAQTVKNLPEGPEMWVQSLGQEDPLEKEKAAHSSILAWRIPWTEEPGGVQATGSKRVGHDWVANTQNTQPFPALPPA